MLKMGVYRVKDEEGMVNERCSPMGLAEWTEEENSRMNLSLWIQIPRVRLLGVREIQFKDKEGLCDLGRDFQLTLPITGPNSCAKSHGKEVLCSDSKRNGAQTQRIPITLSNHKKIFLDNSF